MLHLKTTPVGYDLNIQNHQRLLYTYLCEKWGVGESNYEAYGRCYRNLTESGYRAQVYDNRTEKDYIDCTFDNTKVCISFYGVDQAVSHTGSANSNVNIHLCFLVDLSKIEKDITHRYDYELRKDVYDFVLQGLFGIKLARAASEVTGLERTMQEYDSTRKTGNFSRFDMHPYHAFRFNFELNFKP